MLCTMYLAHSNATVLSTLDFGVLWNVDASELVHRIEQDSIQMYWKQKHRTMYIVQ